MKKTILKIMILNVVLASSCWDVDHSSDFRLRDVDKQMIPYKLGKTVSFVDSLGQNFVLKVIKDSLSRWMESEDYYEFRQVYLQSEDSNVFISLLVVAPSTTVYNYNYIILYINQFYFPLRYNYSKGQFYTDTDRSQYIHDSLEINKKIFYDVVECIKTEATNKEESKEQERFPFRLLYNKMYGVLQLEDKEKTLFTINN